MSWHFIGGLSFKMIWQEHETFRKDFKKVAKKQRGLDDGFLRIKKLLEKQFNPESPMQVIAPGKIHHITTKDSGWALWKVEVMVENVKPNLCPRIWFVINGETITFLALNYHGSNYDDNAIERDAISRFGDVI